MQEAPDLPKPPSLDATLAEDPETLAMMRRIETGLFDLPAQPVRVGRFALQRILGAGGMGVVHLGQDDVLDRRVAIKLIRSERTPSEQERARLLREARAMARVSHANVVQVYEAGEHAGRVFVAMEYVEGETLREWLVGDGASRSWQERLPTLLAAGRGLAAAHAAGVVHRDFKPDNVLLSRTGETKVGDFGLAGVEASRSLETTADGEIGSLTRTGALMGTPLYMAPEQLGGGTADARSDQFAFCVVAYEVLIGQRPFVGDTIASLGASVCAGELQPVPRGCKVPRWLVAVLERGLAVEPDRRWPSMDALLQALSRRRSRGVALASVAAVALLAGIGFVQSAGKDPSRCAAAHGELAGIWDAERRDTTQQAVHATGLAYADDTFARIAPVLDDYATGWTGGWFGACTAQEAGDTVAAAKLACLEHARDELRFVTDDLAVAQLDALRHAVNLVSSLPELHRCEDPERMTAELASLEDPEIRTLLEGLAHAKVLVATRRLAEADALLVEVQAQALAHQRDALEARALVLRSQVAFLGQRHEESQRLAADALALAERSDHDDIAVSAWERMAQASRVRHQLDRANFELDRADAVASRPGTEPETLADLLFHRANVLADGGRHAEAVALGERAIAAYTAISPEHPGISDVQSDLAVSLLQIGRQEQAFAAIEEAATAKARQLGPTHPRMAIVLTTGANHYTAAGRFEDALRLLKQALAVAELYPEDKPGFTVGTAGLVGQTLVSLRRFDEAEQALEHAARLAETYVPNEPQFLSYVATARGNLELDRRRYHAAVPHYERAIAMSSDESWQNRSVVAANLALALAGAGRYEDAVTRADEARAAIADAPAESPIRASIEIYCAEVYRQAGRTAQAREGFTAALAVLERAEVSAELRYMGHFGAARLEPDPARAREHAARAEAALAELPHAEHEREELAAWMKAHHVAAR